jgi:exodeoxyribonuclease VII small subunit
MATRSKKPEQSDPSDRPADELSYEAAVEALEVLIERIESGEIGLEDSIAAYERGTALIKRCRAVLDRAEQRIESLEASLGEDQA